jgi:hypothetical protein
VCQRRSQGHPVGFARPRGRRGADRRGGDASPDPGSSAGNDQRDVGAGGIARWGRMPGSDPRPGVWFEAVAVEVDSGPQPASADGDESGGLGPRRNPCGPPSACEGRSPGTTTSRASRPGAAKQMLGFSATCHILTISCRRRTWARRMRLHSFKVQAGPGSAKRLNDLFKRRPNVGVSCPQSLTSASRATPAATSPPNSSTAAMP